MVVDSTIWAPGRAYWRGSWWTRLLAQTTTSASPMSLAPLTVSRSGAPGPAPINHTLPKLRTPPGKDHCREICPLSPHHLQGGHDFFALDPEPGPVHGAFQPTALLSDPEHLPRPATALGADHRLEPGKCLPQRLLPCRERQQRKPFVAFEEYRPTPRSQVLQRRDPWHSLYLDVRFDLLNGTCQVGEGRIDVGVSDSSERARLAAPQVLGDSVRRVGPVTFPGIRVVRECEEEASDAPFVQILARRGLGPPYLACVSHGHEDLVRLPQHAQTFDGQQFGFAARLDRRVVELVSANVGASLGQRRVRQRAGFPVAEREPVRHRGLCVEHAAHGMPVKLAHQVQQPAALGNHWTPACCKGPNTLPHPPVRGEDLCVGLGEPTTEVESVCSSGQVLLGGRVEGDDLSARALQQLQVLAVKEAERRSRRNRHANATGPIQVRRLRTPGL